MAIRVLLDNLPDFPVILDSVVEDQKGFFRIFGRGNPSIAIEVPYPYGVNPGYNCADTQILLLQNPFHVEASAMDVFIQPGTQRLGYVFSLTSVGSTNHRFSENRFFKTACYAAVFKVLQSLVVERTDVIDLGRRPFRCRVDELFGDELVVLSVHIPFAQSAGIELVQLEADLHRHGYVYAESPIDKPPVRLSIVRANFETANNMGRLRLRPLSKLLASDSLISRFLCRRISCPNDPVLRFFYLYQIVERILNLELRNKSKLLLAQLAAADPNGSKIAEAYHDLKEAFSEKSRLGEVFGVRINSSLQNSPSNQFFKDFLLACGVVAGNAYSENLYKVRNTVFHGWWSIPVSAAAEFDNVVAGIENDIPELILSYLPSVSVLSGPLPDPADDSFCI